MTLTDYLPQTTLPRWARATPSFRELFGVPPREVIAAMDRAEDDVPNSRPAAQIDIDDVSVRRSDLIVRIDDPFGSSQDVGAVCTVSVAAGVPRARRGVHLSRIGEVLAESASTPFRDLVAYAEAMAEFVAASQYGAARVRVDARIPYIEEVQADPSGRMKRSLEHLNVIVRRTIGADVSTTDLGLRVTHITACPCVQKTYQHARACGETSTATDPFDPGPLMTHSQRCVTSVMACGIAEPRPAVEILSRLDAVLVRTTNTLPRDAELCCVYRAHRTPQFIEDALRAAVIAVAGAWPAPASFRCVKGRARSLESIHEYDVTAALSLNASDLPIR
jgi:GTP cyclohydrolase FolE2